MDVDMDMGMNIPVSSKITWRPVQDPQGWDTPAELLLRGSCWSHLQESDLRLPEADLEGTDL